VTSRAWRGSDFGLGLEKGSRGRARSARLGMVGNLFGVPCRLHITLGWSCLDMLLCVLCACAS
jgi:hypothetical protein